MKCPRCGAESSVISTRPYEYGQTIRNRECFNYHRFITIEVHKACYGSTRIRAKCHAETMKRAVALWKRNLYIARHIGSGVESLMNKFGVSRTTVFNALREYRLRVNTYGK